MQLTKEQLTILDTIIERYTEDKTSKEAKLIDEYLKEISIKERDLLINVYFNLSRKPTEEECKIIDEYKIKLYNLLIDSKVKRGNESLMKKSRLENEHKIKRLSRLKKLKEEITTLHSRLYSLELELENYDSVKITNLSTEKVNTSSQDYSFGSFRISCEIDNVRSLIHNKVLEWEEERGYLYKLFSEIEDIRAQQIFHLRYLNILTWDEISSEVNKSKTWCSQIHSKYIKTLQL